jgi:hypothetical protein
MYLLLSLTSLVILGMEGPFFHVCVFEIAKLVGMYNYCQHNQSLLELQHNTL